MDRKARITVITAGHPSTCPRMVKAADALAEEGHEVRFVGTRFLDWAAHTDLDLLARRPWRTLIVDYDRSSAPLRSLHVRARRRVAAEIVSRRGAAKSPWWAVTRAFSYVHPELVRAAMSEPTDLYYGGTSGALAAAAEAATRSGRPYALDLEDLHTAESEGPNAAMQHGLAGRIESRVLAGARVLTTSSTAIGDAYHERYGRRPEVIHNVFPLPPAPSRVKSPSGELRAYWMGQTIGPGRGLDEFVEAAGLAAVPMSLHLRGREQASYMIDLRQRAAARASLLSIECLPPAPPDDMVSSAAGYDIGVSIEIPNVENRNRCLPNKLLTYLSAGLAVVATATLGQREVASTTGSAVAWYAPRDTAQLAAHLRGWHEDRAALSRAQLDARRAAETRWHWEHPLERERLITAITGALA